MLSPFELMKLKGLHVYEETPFTEDLPDQEPHTHSTLQVYTLNPDGILPSRNEVMFEDLRSEHPLSDSFSDGDTTEFRLQRDPEDGQDMEDEINDLLKADKRNFYFYKNKSMGKNRERSKNRKLKNGKTGRKGRKKGKGRKQKQAESAQADESLKSNNIIDYDSEEREPENNIMATTEKPRKIYHSCNDLLCKAGGKCVQDEMRGGYRCQCRLGAAGEFCEQGKNQVTCILEV